MEDSRRPLTPPQLLQRMKEASDWLYSLEKSDPTYASKKMVGESRLSNLEEAWKDPVKWNNEQRDTEENLRTAQQTNMFLPLATDGPEDLQLDEQRPHSSHETLTIPTGFAPYAGSHINPFGGHFASDGVMAGQGRPAHVPTWNLSSENTTGPGTPDISNDSTDRPSSASASSVDSASLVSRKRPRDSLHSSGGSSRLVNKVHRTIVSPPSTTANTPSSFGSPQRSESIPEDFNALFGENPNEAAEEFVNSRKDQEAHLIRMQEKRQQELEDEAFAKSLQERFNDLPSSSPPVPRAGPSNIAASQTYFGNHGQILRPNRVSTPPTTIKRDPFAPPPTPLETQTSFRPSTTPAVKRENPSVAQSSHTAVKRDPFSGSGIGWDDYVTISSDEESEEQTNIRAAQPSSDLVEIDGHAWDQRYGQAVPGAFPSGNTMPGASNNVVGPMATGVWNGMTSMAQGYAHGLSSGLSNAYSGAAEIIGGGSSVYQDHHLPVINLEDDDDYTGGNFYQRNMTRAGLNPMDVDLVNRYRERYDYIAQDPTKNLKEMKELLENIRPDEDLSISDREGTPVAMLYPLMEHQKLGVAWMRRMEEGTNRGGILADDMGLGKTIQALALMVSRRSEDPSCKTTLIVAPVALLKQWEREIDKKLKPGRQHSLSTLIYHGAKSRPPWEKLRTYDVVLTTFGVVATELKRKNYIDIAKKENPNWRPTSSKDVLSLLGDHSKWYRVIVDEAQCIKNRNTRAAQGCCLLDAKTRFCMTGTPMMNNVGELYSLIHFLRIRPYCDREKFRHDIESPLKSSSESAQKKSMKQLQAVLKSLLLRRTKKSFIDGKPILDLPPRTTTVQDSTFTEDEVAFYKSLEMQTQLQFNKYLRAGTVGRNYSNILVLLLRLRQACCHPHLLKDFGQKGGPSDLSDQDMIKLAQELAPEVVLRIKEQAASNESSQLECPICMDMAVNPTIFLPCGHDTCSECFARITDPSQAIQDGDVAEGPREAKCPNCRGKIVLSRVIDFNAFKKVHMPELCKDDPFDGDPQEADTTDASDSDDSDSDDDDDVDNQGNLKGFIVDDDEDSVKDEVTDDDDAESKTKPKPPKSAGKPKGKGKGKAVQKKGPKKTLAQMKKEAGIGSKARAKYLKKLAKDWQTSAKVDKAMDILREVRMVKDEQTGQAEKTIIFSQFTSLLDLLEFPINQEGWNYRRYDGSMTPKSRNEAVLDFTDKPEVKIMLVSLKAGNAGLNLTAASHVIIFDPFWNPYIEEQAIDRAHRIGQLRPVKVHRLLVPNTVEDRIIALQEKKRTLIEGALDEKASQSIGRLGTRELAFLFDVPAS